MEPLYLDFSDSAAFSGKQRFLGILLCVIGLMGTTILAIDNNFGVSFYINIFWVFYGIFMFSPYPRRISSKNNPFFSVDNELIQYKTTPFTFSIKEEWKNISGVTIKNRAVYINTLDGRKKKINLNWVSHRNVLVIKQTMKDYATSKDLEVFIIND